MKTYIAHPASPDKFLHAEGALWCPRRQCFLFVDILDKKIGMFDPVTGAITLIPTDSYVGTVVVDNNGGLVAALQDKFVRITDSSGKYTVLAELEPEIPGNRSNDGKCDPAGRFWIGTMAMDVRPNAGSLYCFDGKTLTKMIAETTISNGLCWSDDTRVMYYIDSADPCIQAFDYDLATGQISHPRVVATIPEKDGTPDGMCMDTDGMLWVALWGGSCVKCFHPATGELLAKVEVDAPLVSSCALGGKDGRQLFITTSREGLDDTMAQRYPLSGSLFIADVDACAGKTYEFNTTL